MSRSLLNPVDRQAVVTRLRALRPEAPARWGSMSAPRMIAHLIDQMQHTVSETHLRPSRSPLRYPGIKQLALHWIPWPRGRIKGPRAAFVTQPSDWGADVTILEGLIEQFVQRPASGYWTGHPFFGEMSKAEWGVFSFRHFDHHLRQFGQ